MMLVACPVTLAAATCRTGLYCGAGVVLGDPDQEAGEHHADHRGAVEVPARVIMAASRRRSRTARVLDDVAHDEQRDRIEGDERERAGHGEALVERRHDVRVARLAP